MRHIVYFLIEPNEAAREEFPKLAAKHAELLLDPLLTSRCFADRSAWGKNETEMAVKLIFLARMREYLPFESDEAASRILGSRKISIDLFDRWWSIRQFGLAEGPSEEMEDYLSKVVDRVSVTGSATVDEWVKGLRGAAV